MRWIFLLVLGACLACGIMTESGSSGDPSTPLERLSDYNPGGSGGSVSYYSPGGSAAIVSYYEPGGYGGSGMLVIGDAYTDPAPIQYDPIEQAGGSISGSVGLTLSGSGGTLTRIMQVDGGFVGDGTSP